MLEVFVTWVGAVILSIVVGGEFRRLHQHKKLGERRMLIPSTNGRWPAYLLFLLGAIKGIEMIVDWSKTGEIRWFDAGYIATMVLCGFQVLRSLGGLGIHQHGVDLGNIALLWSDIDRWEQPERRAEVHFWTGSPWRFLAVVRPSSPVRFRGMLNAEAARILSERLSPRTDR